MASGDMTGDKVVVENVNHPGHTSRVDRAKYDAMRAVRLSGLPAAEPGLTQKEMTDAAREAAPEEHWPGGEKVGWWVKTVQLDLEAKGLVIRTETKPLRWLRGG